LATALSAVASAVEVPSPVALALAAPPPTAPEVALTVPDALVVALDLAREFVSEALATESAEPPVFVEAIAEASPLLTAPALALAVPPVPVVADEKALWLSVAEAPAIAVPPPDSVLAVASPLLPVAVDFEMPPSWALAVASELPLPMAVESAVALL
jgi:hypothetical protein